MIRRVVTLSGTYTVPANPPNFIGERLEYIFIQDGTGGRAVTWDATFLRGPQPSAAANAISRMEFISPDGTNWVYSDALFQAPWSTILQAKGSLAASTTAGTYIMKTDGTALTVSSAAMTAASAFLMLDSAQYAMPGKVVQLRMVASVLNNATAPAATFTFRLAIVSSLAAFVPTLAGLTGVQDAVVTTPGANVQAAAYSAAWSMPGSVGQGLAITVITSATIATSANPFLTCLLQARVL